MIVGWRRWGGCAENTVPSFVFTKITRVESDVVLAQHLSN